MIPDWLPHLLSVLGICVGLSLGSTLLILLVTYVSLAVTDREP